MKRRLLSLLLAVLVVTALMPASAMAAGDKTVFIKETATIGGKRVNVTLKDVPEKTKLKVSGAKTDSWENAVTAKMDGIYRTVLVVNIKASPALKKAASVTVTATALKGLKASGLRVFRIADGQAKEIRDFSVKDKDLRFKTKALGVIVVVQPVVEEAEESAAPIEEPAEELAEEPAEEPVEDPVEDPAEEPAEEPAEVPAEEPAEEPAAKMDDRGSLQSEDLPEVYTGTCGGNGSVKFDLTDGLLQIYGLGAMDDFIGTHTPWYEYREKIETVSINNGVTGIGSYAFYGCSNLREVLITDDLLTIGENIFKNCTGLTSISIPQNVTSIEIPLTADSGIREIIVASQNSVYGSADGVLFNASKTELLEYPAAKSGQYSIPSGVTSIGEDAFRNCSGLIGINVPGNVKTIGRGAFCGCENLLTVSISSGVSTIGEGVFDRCKKLEKVTIPASVTSCAGMFVDDWSNLNDYPNLTSAGPAGSGCSIEFGWKETIPDHAFRGLTGLENLTLPSTIKTLGEGFLIQQTSDGSLESSDLSALREIVVEEGGRYFCSVDGVLYNGSKTEILMFPHMKWGSCHIPSGVTTVPASAFWSSYGVTDVTIPDTVTSIGDYAFQYCRSLNDVQIAGSVQAIPRGAFSGSSIMSVTIGNGVTRIEDDAFLECSSLKEVTLPASVKNIGYMAFNDCESLENVYLSGTPNDYLNCSVEAWNGSLTGARLHYTHYPLHSESFTGGGHVVFYVGGNPAVLAAPVDVVRFVCIPDDGWEFESVVMVYATQPGLGSISGHLLYELEYTQDPGMQGSYTFILPDDNVGAEVIANFREKPGTDYSYKIYFDKNAKDATGSMSAISGKVSEGKSLPANTFKYTGKEFTGWNTMPDGSGTSFANGESIRNIVYKNNMKITLYAQWETKTYPVVYELNGGQDGPAPQVKKYGKTLTLSTVKPVREGFKFLGWATSMADSQSGKVTYPAGVKNTYTKNARLTLYAAWKEKTYTVTYDANGGTNAPAKQTKYYTKDLTLRGAGTKPTRIGYTLTGWFDKANGIEYALKGTYTVNKSVTLYAIWKPIHYTIVFRGAGAENAMEPIEAVYDRSYTVTNAFVRTGYTINAEAAWKDAGGKTYADGAKVRNLTAEEGGTAVLTAQWTPNKYKVKFAPGTVAVGEVSGTMSTVAFTYGKKETLPAVAFKAKGYKLLYWESESGFTYLNQQKVKNLAPKGTITLTAVWAKIKYNINYELNGGKNPDDAADSFTVESDKTPLPSPTKKGYVFKGWFNNAAFKGSPIKAIPAHSSKNYTLYAKWTPITYTVVYSSNGGSGSMESSTKKVKYGETYTFEKNGFKAPKGYAFGGWICDDGTECIVYNAGQKVKNLTTETNGVVIIKAKWDPKSESRDYHLTFIANGGTGHMDDMFLKATDKIPECGFTAPADQVFNCWKVRIGGKELDIAAGSELKDLIKAAPEGTKDFTLTADWKPILSMDDDAVMDFFYPYGWRPGPYKDSNVEDSISLGKGYYMAGPCVINSITLLLRRYQVNTLHIYDTSKLMSTDAVFAANGDDDLIDDWAKMAAWMGQQLSTENKPVTVKSVAGKKTIDDIKELLKDKPEGILCYFKGGRNNHAVLLILEGDAIKKLDIDTSYLHKWTDENGVEKTRWVVDGRRDVFPGDNFTTEWGYPNDQNAMLTTYLAQIYYINH